MDGEGARPGDLNISSGSDDVHETSFMTAHSNDDDDNHSTSAAVADDIKSSRSMPVPDYMKRRSEENLYVEESRPLQAGYNDDGDDDEPSLPPPTYEEATAVPQTLHEDKEELTTDEIDIIMRTKNVDTNSINLATEDETHPRLDGACNNDVETTMRLRQRDRDTYLPSSQRRNSFAEAIEMQHRKSLELPKDDIDNGTTPDRVTTSTQQIQQFDVEENRERKEYTCTSCGPLDGYITSLCRFLRRQSKQRLILFSVLMIGVLGLLLFVSLFPASFVYIDYHEIALKQSKMTNVVDRENVYYHGCYVLGPDTNLVKFDASVHNIIEEMSVFTLDTITVTIRYSAHYFLRPPEVGKLYTKFMFDYDEVFRLIIRSSLRNLAGATLTVDNFRFNRTYVETQIHSMLRKRLGGDCCPECCKETPRLCQSNKYCSECNTNINCNQGYHIDVRYFHLLSVAIPNEVFEIYLHRTIMMVNEEKEFHLQSHSMTEKQTELEVKNISNEADEIREKGRSESYKLTLMSNGEHENIVQTGYFKALKQLYNSLNITDEAEKVRLMLNHALVDNAHNLYEGYGFDKNTLFTP
ncbi:hypothetical protein ACF0H5_023545 [Mactra antiquata]